MGRIELDFQLISGLNNELENVSLILDWHLVELGVDGIILQEDDVVREDGLFLVFLSFNLDHIMHALHFFQHSGQLFLEVLLVEIGTVVVLSEIVNAVVGAPNFGEEFGKEINMSLIFSLVKRLNFEFWFWDSSRIWSTHSQAFSFCLNWFSKSLAIFI